MGKQGPLPTWTYQRRNGEPGCSFCRLLWSLSHRQRQASHPEHISSGDKILLCSRQLGKRASIPRASLHRRKTPVDVALPLIDATLKVVDTKDVRFIFDRWFSVGQLLEFLDKNYQVEFVTLLRLHRNRVKEMQRIPKDRFRRLNDTQRIAPATTSIRNYTGKLKLIVIEEEDEDPPLRGYLTNVQEDIEPRLISRVLQALENRELLQGESISPLRSSSRDRSGKDKPLALLQKSCLSCSERF